jgi:carboxylesterase type B
VLKWVKAHIAQFGGNPDRVTLIGEDGGAASVTFLAMSPLAQVGEYRLPL